MNNKKKKLYKKALKSQQFCIANMIFELYKKISLKK